MRIKKQSLKILILIIILQFAIFKNVSYASIWGDIISAGDNFIETGRNAQINEETKGPEDYQVKQIINEIYSILFPLGVVITVIVGGVLGIKFMMASAEDKAKVKESMVPYVIGCAVIYGAFGIWKIAIELFSSLT